jgi:hypothetical protein
MFSPENERKDNAACSTSLRHVSMKVRGSVAIFLLILQLSANFRLIFCIIRRHTEKACRNPLAAGSSLCNCRG